MMDAHRHRHEHDPDHRQQGKLAADRRHHGKRGPEPERPESPMKSCAGWTLNHRKPISAPITSAQKMARFGWPIFRPGHVDEGDQQVGERRRPTVSRNRSLGTEPQLAVRSYMNDQKAPQALVSTGATEFSSQYKQYPWTIGWQPDYIAEGRLYGLHVKANQKGKKIAVIYQNDDYGKDYLYGFRAALGKTYADENIVAQEAIEPTATSAASQITRIKASGAQVFAVFQLPTPTVRSIATAKALGFNPDQIYMNSVAAIKPAVDAMVGAAGAAYTNGIITIAYYKDPQDSRWANDPAIKLYRSIIAKYSGGANADDPQVLYGVAKADTFVQALYKAGKNPTRASLMSALTNLDTTSNFLLPGMKMKTSSKDHYVISQMQLQRLNSSTKLFVPFGALIEGRPR